MSSSPVSTKDKINLLFGVNFQYQYAQFTNISQLSKYYFIKQVSRELRRDADILEMGDSRDLEGKKDERLIFYRSIADLMNAKGMDGFACVLRAICDAAQFPVKDEGIVGEILHVLLSPDYGVTPFDDEDTDKTDISPYIDVAVAGRQIFRCAQVYGGCPQGQGVMELISSLKDD